jgi:hypothetical protein
MTVGYFLESIIAFTLTCTALAARHRSVRSSIVDQVLPKTYEVFHSYAIFLTFSIQIAVTLVLIRTNYGINTNGTGAFTLQITWTVSLMSLLPLMYALFMPGLFEVDQHTTQPQIDDQVPSEKKHEERMARSLRLCLYILCWMLSIYPFVSSLLNKFGPSQIGDGPGTAISTHDWGIIESICFDGVKRIEVSEARVMDAFLLATWLFVYLSSAGRLLYLAFGECCSDREIIDSPAPKNITKKIVERAHLLILLLVPFFTIGQAWTYLRLQAAQMEMASKSNNSDSDRQWSFGQVVAVSVFAPVVVEAVFATYRLKRSARLRPVISSLAWTSDRSQMMECGASGLPKRS